MELFLLKEGIIWNTFPISSSAQAVAKKLQGPLPPVPARLGPAKGSRGPSRPPLATGFRRHLQIIVQTRKVQIHHSSTLLELSLIFPVLKVSLVSHTSAVKHQLLQVTQIYRLFDQLAYPISE